MALLDLLCPTTCAGCGEPGRLACSRCLLPLAASAVPHRPTPCPRGMPDTWVVCSYDGTTRSLLLGFKERGAIGLGTPLGAALARAIAPLIPLAGERVLVVPIPSTAASVRRRGDDVVRLLALRACAVLRRGGCNARMAPVLAPRRVLADSAGLTAAQRAANLDGALSVRGPAALRLRGVKVVIVDDLVTTGATLCEAARALEQVGAVVTGAAAVAATRRLNCAL